MKIYLAGPMRGYKHYNFDAFDVARIYLRGMGHTVLCPAETDRLHCGFTPEDLPEDHDYTTFPPEAGTLEETVARDLLYVQLADGLCMLHGWRDSKGAQAEHAVAVWLGKDVFYGVEEVPCLKV